jgi:pilus assembly protein Flp/PilA
MRDLTLGLYARMLVFVDSVNMSLVGNEDGQDMVEYAIVLGLVAMGAVAATRGLATSIGSGFTSIGSHLTAYTS